MTYVQSQRLVSTIGIAVPAAYFSTNTIVPGSGRFQLSHLHGRCPNNDRKNTTCPGSVIFFGVRIMLGTMLGRFSIIYFRRLGLRIKVMVWVMVRARVWVRVGVGVRVSVVLWSW